MTRHRGLSLALALCALIGLSTRESRAAGITMTLTWSGGSLTFNSVISSPYVLAGSSATSLLVNTDAINSVLSKQGSAITFSALGAQSDFPGAAAPANASLNETGTAFLSGTGATAITVTASESGFTSPIGSDGLLSSAQTALFTNIAAGGSQASDSSFDSMVTPTLTSISTGMGLDAHSPSNSMGTGTVASGFALGNSFTIDMTGSTPGLGTSTQFAVATTLSATAIPEPASIIMMLTGLPLPLVVLGLLRRRRAAA